jgi:hypothetical protein
MIVVAKYLRCKVEETKDLDHMDFYIINPDKPELKHPVEVKCRTTRKDQYRTFYVSHKKWLAGKAEAAERGSRFYLVIQFSDGIYFSNETDKTDTGTRYTEVNGRRDRSNAANDIEVVIHIPHSELKPMPVRVKRATI